MYVGANMTLISSTFTKVNHKYVFFYDQYGCRLVRGLFFLHDSQTSLVEQFPWRFILIIAQLDEMLLTMLFRI